MTCEYCLMAIVHAVMAKMCHCGAVVARIEQGFKPFECTPKLRCSNFLAATGACGVCQPYGLVICF